MDRIASSIQQDAKTAILKIRRKHAFMKRFNFEEERIKKEIIKLGAKRVLIQLPEGLKPEAPRLAKVIEKSGALPIISADPCYGACDLAMTEAEDLSVDLIVHFGHSKFVKHERVPTIYINVHSSLDVSTAVENALCLLGNWKKIGLVTTVQHVQTLDQIRGILVRNGKTVIIGDAGQLNFPGQITGCDYSNALSIAEEVEAFLFVGGGKFHATGVTLSTSKPTVVADPYDNVAFSVDQEAQKVYKQRWANIEEARKAENFAVIIGLKPGQKRLETALEVKKLLEHHGKTVYLFAAKETTPEALMEFPTIDAYINTSCPRVSLDDAPRYMKPLLSVNEAHVLVGELTWEELCKKGLLES